MSGFEHSQFCKTCEAVKPGWYNDEFWSCNCCGLAFKLSLPFSKEPTLIKGGLAIDDRGCVTFANDFNFQNVKRFYMVENHRKGFIRAWHGHRKEAKYVLVVQGSALFGVVPLYSECDCSDCNKVIKTFVLSSRKPEILYIPAGYYNGFKTLEENTKIMFFSTSTLEESLGDDVRKNYDHWNIWSENFR